MKIIRFVDSDGAIQLGRDLGDGTAVIVSGDAEERPPTKVVKLLAPIVPTAIIGIGLNYRRHADETGGKYPDYPIVFYKGPNSLQNPFDPIELPRHLRSDEVDYECELAVVIGQSAKNVARERALDYVLGYTCANDVSARDWQMHRSGRQWCHAKSFDTFCPLGPCLVTTDEIKTPNNLQLRTLVNGEVRQDWNTSDMIFDVPALIEYLSGSTTLLAGTVILTGTPHGVGMSADPPFWLKAGDSVTVEIDGIGQLTNPVVEELV